MNKLETYIRNPRLLGFGLMKRMAPLFRDDELYLKILYYLKMGKRLNLENPQTFSEKLQWLKLYNRRPEYTMMVDKYAVKEYVASIIGKEYVIPTLGLWDRPEDIEWDALPGRFVLKTTHGGGNTGVVICKDKSKFDREAAIKKLNKSLKQNIYLTLREWPYKGVPRRIIAEAYLESRPKTADLPDYKIFCINGEPKFCQVISGRGGKMCVDFFDADWKHQPFHEPRNYPFAETEPKKPKHFYEIWRTAGKLAKGNPFVRIDFYDIDEHVYFGEITFFPTSGMGEFSPSNYDEIIGKMLVLSGERMGG